MNKSKKRKSYYVKRGTPRGRPRKQVTNRAYFRTVVDHACKRNGLKFDELAIKIGMAPSTLYQVTNGYNGLRDAQVIALSQLSGTAPQIIKLSIGKMPAKLKSLCEQDPEKVYKFYTGTDLNKAIGKAVQRPEYIESVRGQQNFNSVIWDKLQQQNKKDAK